MKKTFLVFALFVTPLLTVASPQKDQAVEKKVRELLSKMTLEEKIGQMSQRMARRSRVSDEQRTKWIVSEAVGSLLNAEKAGDWKQRNEYQKQAVEESRLGIPLIIGRDVIHGYQTMLPIPLGQSCSWDPELIEKGARVAAVEASADGIHWTFAPMIDITRDPRWGRIAETCGEDPYLTSVLGAAMIKGFQGSDLSNPDSIVACAKHYVGYGATEGGRDYNSTFIPENQLRNIFLPSFHAAVEAGVGTFMSGFNNLNGVPVTGNSFTLQTVLRDEWGFDGFVVSDWESVTEMIVHGFCADEREAALDSVRAGLNMEMKSEAYAGELKGLVEEGLVSEARIDEMVAGILRVKIRKGLFEHPFNDGANRDKILSPEHLAVARQLAEESAVLLKNEGLLPLSPGKKIALIGPLADSPVDQMGCWAMDGEADAVVTPRQAFEELLGDNLLFVQGLETSRSRDRSGFAAAVKAAEEADAVVLILGEEKILSGEAHCRAFLNLPGLQEELVEEIAKTGKPITVVIMAGRPLVFQKTAHLADAVLYYYHPGTMGGPALADLLFGRVSPSGKLTTTFPRTVGQIPIYYAHDNTGRPPVAENRGAPMGTPLDPKNYTSQYLDVDFTPEYVFGHGLTYTTFKYDNLKLSAAEMPADGTITVSATITNTGKVEATEIVQLYIRDRVAQPTRPVKELKGFRRIALQPGKSKTVSFELSATACGFYGLDNTFAVQPGDMKLWISPSSAEGLEADFQILEK